MKKKKRVSLTFTFQTIIIVAVVILSAFGLLLQSFDKLKTPLLRADFISTLLPASAPFHGLGSPYRDYWEVRPPALPLMTGLWGVVFSDSLWSFHILWLLFLAGILRMTWVILGKLFSFSEKVIVYVFFVLFFCANSVQTQFFPPEINGLFFTLAGFVFALKAKPSRRDIFFSSFFFIVASQMKEVFAFAGLSLFPHVVNALFVSKKELWQFIVSVISGAFFAGLIILAYLFFNHSLIGYKEILQYKSQVFQPTNWRGLMLRVSPALDYLVKRFLAVPYQAIWLFTAAAVGLLVWLKQRGWKQLLKTGLLYAVAVCYSLGSFAGYLMQDRRNHIYDIAILLGFTLLVALSAKLLAYFLFGLLPTKLQKKPSYLQLLVFIFIGIFLLPNKLIFNENLNQLKNYDPQLHLTRWLDAEKPIFARMEIKVKDHTSPTDCIDAQHGWNVGQQYYYTQRRPCTRFFLTNILPIERIPEYQSQLVTHLPAAVIYYTELTDLDVTHFNETIFNFGKVLKNCFVQDDEFPKLYWPASKGDTFSECFKSGLPS